MTTHVHGVDDRTSYLRDHFRYRVFHLQTGVELEEKEVVVIHGVKVLYRARVAVANLSKAHKHPQQR